MNQTIIIPRKAKMKWMKKKKKMNKMMKRKVRKLVIIKKKEKKMKILHPQLKAQRKREINNQVAQYKRNLNKREKVQPIIVAMPIKALPNKTITLILHLLLSKMQNQLIQQHKVVKKKDQILLKDLKPQR